MTHMAASLGGRVAMRVAKASSAKSEEALGLLEPVAVREGERAGKRARRRGSGLLTRDTATSNEDWSAAINFQSHSLRKITLLACVIAGKRVASIASIGSVAHCDMLLSAWAVCFAAHACMPTA